MNPLLIPTQATRDFMIADEDAIMSFDQVFTVNTPAPPARARRRVVRRPTVQAPVRRIPSRMSMGRR
jgi:hypothetical protein